MPIRPGRDITRLINRVTSKVAGRDFRGHGFITFASAPSDLIKVENVCREVCHPIERANHNQPSPLPAIILVPTGQATCPMLQDVIAHVSKAGGISRAGIGMSLTSTGQPITVIDVSRMDTTRVPPSGMHHSFRERFSVARSDHLNHKSNRSKDGSSAIFSFMQRGTTPPLL